jgi:pimeloyl-ACP methyl ester carboxylesterase
VIGHSLGADYAPIVAKATLRSSLVYLCPAPVGPFSRVGAPMRASRKGFPFPPEGADGTSAWEPDVAISVIYPRLSPELAHTLARRLKPGSAPVDTYPLRTPPDVPTSFIYARHDEFFDPAWSRWVASEAAGLEPVELDTGHFPMIEAPDELAGILLDPDIGPADARGDRGRMASGKTVAD